MICDRSHFTVQSAQITGKNIILSFVDDVVKVNLHRCELQTNECEKKESMGMMNPLGFGLCVGSGYFNSTRS